MNHHHWRTQIIVARMELQTSDLCFLCEWWKTQIINQIINQIIMVIFHPNRKANYQSRRDKPSAVRHIANVEVYRAFPQLGSSNPSFVLLSPMFVTGVGVATILFYCNNNMEVVKPPTKDSGFHACTRRLVYYWDCSRSRQETSGDSGPTSRKCGAPTEILV